MTLPNCATCTRPMRPRDTLAADYPGTVATHSVYTCRGCEDRYRRTGVTPAVAAEQIDVGDRWNLMRPAQCGDDSFFPSTRNGTNPNYAEPRVICAACPVREFGCKPFILKAESGMSRFAREGFAAGMTPGDRAKADPITRAQGARHQIKHGTEAGHMAHRRLGEVSCDLCRVAAATATRERRTRFAAGESRKPEPIDHGTIAGYYKHRRRKERSCDPCRAARTRHDAELARVKRAADRAARAVIQVDAVAEIMAAAEVERAVAVGTYGDGWAAA